MCHIEASLISQFVLSKLRCLCSQYAQIAIVISLERIRMLASNFSAENRENLH